MASVGVAGSIGATLVLNLPGSPKGVRESLDAVLPVVPHAIELLGGVTGAHPTGHGEARDPAWKIATSPSLPSFAEQCIGITSRSGIR